MAERKYIKRHDIYARIAHWAYAVGGIVLGITGLFLFIPGLGRAVGIEGLTVTTILHRVFGVLFIAVPLATSILRPANPIHTFKNLFAKWDADDIDFMKKFAFYLFNPKKYHMPKQQFIKSGQRISDLIMYLLILGIAVSGVLLWVGSNVLPLWLFRFSLFIHDLCFFGMGLLFVVHVYLGAGVFQPYRRSASLMMGDGMVSESDALYHWGHWANEELASGKNVVVVEVPDDEVSHK